ncbi:hypothetical protein HHI36_006540 [Cryptolaemus montrouzieri]|uniref:Uncharacterized protein n=1 Tax=Cryptolaemus montrouzieri TaxID=559131 RepID=A0ABD2NXD6_9CUCU
MARTYKRKLGARKYADYSRETLEACLVNNAAVRNAEKWILDDNSSDDIDFDKIDAEQQQENVFLESVERNNFLDDDSRFASVNREVGEFVVFTYENKMYGGETLGFVEEKVVLYSMEKSLKM